MEIAHLKPNAVVRGSLFSEPVQVIAVIPMGGSVKLYGKGLRTGQVHEPVLTPEQLATLEISSDRKCYDDDALRFRLGVEAMRLKIAYEYAPYFSLSIARVDPLPRKLNIVDDYFIALPCRRFLLADDPPQDKTVMAEFLLNETNIQGLDLRGR